MIIMTSLASLKEQYELIWNIMLMSSAQNNSWKLVGHSFKVGTLL